MWLKGDFFDFTILGNSVISFVCLFVYFIIGSVQNVLGLFFHWFSKDYFGLLLVDVSTERLDEFCFMGQEEIDVG